MPLYDFKCDKCEKVFEIQLSFSEERQSNACLDPDCNGSLERLFSVSTSFQLKGSGWTGNNLTRKKD